MKNKDLTFGNILKPTLILGLVCLITTLLLAIVNSITYERIYAQEILIQNEAELFVMPDSKAFEKIDSPDGSFTYTEALDGNGEVIGYIFRNAINGYGGPVTVNVGVDLDGLITGVKAMDLSETPNIGMKVSEDEFGKQFIGKTVGIALGTGENEVEAISGATVSSTAFMQAVQKGLEQYQVIAGGQNE